MNKTNRKKTNRKNKNKTKKCSKTFSKHDYNSNDGMLTSVWGPSLWHYMHTMSFNYPVKPTKEHKKNYKDFIINLKNILPCGHCRENLKKNFKYLPLKMCDLKNRDAFSRYVFNLHETVNKMLNKKSGLTYETVRDRYENFRSRCTMDKPKMFTVSKFRKTIKKKRESGCTVPLYGKKAKSIIKIVPQDNNEKTLQIDKACIKIRD
tara:strand:- start:130 stop:747 length:618 start_codon:yes stop_codon:yes gene_type:complete